MSRGQDARWDLELLLSRGAIKAWTDACEGSRYVVTTNDDKRHTWTPAQVVAFFAGYCAGRSNTQQGASA